MEATPASFLSCPDQLFKFRDMFILGYTVKVYMQGSQFVFADCKLAICNNLRKSEIAVPIELVQRSKHRYNNVPIHGRGTLAV